MLLLALALPLAVYLLVLARINRRRRALIVSGPWDFAGILFAASGFLLFGGPALLSILSLNETWRRFWLRGRASLDLAHDDVLFTVRVVLFALYFVAVVAGAAFLLWRRRRLTAIYNVDPLVVETALGQVIERWQLPFVQSGNLLTFEPDNGTTRKGLAVPAGETPAGPAALPFALVERPSTLEVDVNPSFCHVTLIWNPPDSRLRREVESQLERALAEAPAPAGPIGDWLLIAAYLFFFLILIVGSVLLLLWLLKR